MHHPTIPDHDNAFRKMGQQISHERLGFLGMDVLVEHGEVQSQPATLRRNGNGRNDREPIASIPTVVDRCLPLRGPRATHRGLQQEAAFIGKNKGFTASAGVFLCAASLFCTTQPWLVRRAPAHGVRASGSSSPCVAAGAKHPTDRRSRRSVCESPRRSAPRSTVRWQSRGASPLAEAASANVRFVACSISAWGRDGLWPLARGDHRAGTPSPTGRQPRELPPPAEPPRTDNILVSAASSLVADAAPHPCVIRTSPCEQLSAKTECFNELFKAQ